MVNADSERRSKAASRLIEVLVADSDPACSAGSISTTGARRDIFDCSTTTPPAPIERAAQAPVPRRAHRGLSGGTDLSRLQLFPPGSPVEEAVRAQLRDVPSS